MKFAMTILAILAVPMTAFGAASISVTSPTLVVAPGTPSIQAIVSGTMDESFFAFDASLDGPAGLSVGAFSFAGGVFAADAGNAYQGLPGAKPIVGTMDPTSGSLGAYSASTTYNAGSYQLITLTINGIGGLAPGQYPFALVGGEYSVQGGTPFPYFSTFNNLAEPFDSNTGFTLTVTPEPASLLLLGLGGLFLRRRG